MKSTRHLLIAFLVTALLSSCSSLFPEDQVNISLPTETPLPIIEITEVPNTPPIRPASLLVWVPPEFDLSIESEASSLLNDQIISFQNNHPNVQIEVRVKANDGPANLLNSLGAAQNAAPLSLPDLILLSTEDMQNAATNDYLHPMGEYLQLDFPENWYDIAIEQGTFENEIYGLTFAIDALVLTYHPELIDTPPIDWAQALETSGVLSFPAADSQSLFTLVLYLSQGGTLFDENGKFSLEEEKLLAVYNFFEEGLASNLFPYWLTQYEKDSSSWQAFLDGRGSMAITWSSRYLKSDGDFKASTIPTIDGIPYTLTSGWVFSLTGTNPEKAQLATELAEHLTDSQFLGKWTESIGYLPPRPSSLSEWENGPQQALANLILSSAGVVPPASTLNLLGEKLMQVTVDVLKQEKTSTEATIDILNNFNN